MGDEWESIFRVTGLELAVFDFFQTMDKACLLELLLALVERGPLSLLEVHSSIDDEYDIMF